MNAICGDCGHHVRLRDAEGRCTAPGCPCALYAPSADAQQAEAATEAARRRQVEQTRLERAARTALSARRYDELLGATLALLAHDRKANR